MVDFAKLSNNRSSHDTDRTGKYCEQCGATGSAMSTKECPGRVFRVGTTRGGRGWFAVLYNANTGEPESSGIGSYAIQLEAYEEAKQWAEADGYDIEPPPTPASPFKRVPVPRPAQAKLPLRTGTRYYAGIGSRETPADVQKGMTTIAQKLRVRGFVLRSGAAFGADAAFEAGSTEHFSDIYLPWKGYNDHKSLAFTQTREAIDIAATYHPNWDACTLGARKLHARNTHIMLGADCDTPVEFVICWTKNGKDAGGTGQAIRIARALAIPVFDLYYGRSALDEIAAYLEANP